jgi:hypothetical protein
LFMLRQGCIRLDQINLILKNDNILQTHNLNGCQMLGSLGLRTGFIARHEK